MPRRVQVASVLAGVAIILSAGMAYAHAPLAGSSQSVAYGSLIPHARVTNVQLYGSIRNYSYMVTDYHNARGHLTDEVWGHTYASPVFSDVPPGSSVEPDLWIVEAGTQDEGVLNLFFGFDGCSSSTAWGKTYWVTTVGQSGHYHSVKQKICVWPNRIGNGNRLGVNSQGLRWQYLTLGPCPVKWCKSLTSSSSL
jgi:hypothetical protein